MNEIITEKNYPIQRLWIFKSIINLLIIFIFWILFSLFFYLLDKTVANKETYTNFFIVIASVIIICLIIAVLRRENFHYSIGEKFLTLKQGILLKQQRYIPYGVIQTILVKQDLFDRILGLASLTIENASLGAGASAVLKQKFFEPRFGTQQSQQGEVIGSYGNAARIPGLTKADAEALKNIILQKMKENPIEDGQSGL